MEDKYRIRKFDIETPEGSVIHGAIYTEKPSFNYTEELKNKDKKEEIKKLKKLRDMVCMELRINKNDMVIDENYFRLLTSRRIVVKYQMGIKRLKLVPAIAEETSDNPQLSIEIEYL